MSFAINAAPFNENIDDLNSKSDIDRKKLLRNKTIKKRDNSLAIDAMIQKIHNNPNNDDTNLSDFNAPDLPISAGVQRTIEKDNNIDANNNEMEDNPVSVEGFRKLENNAINYNQGSVPTYYNQMSENQSINLELSNKINYMIHLLEEQQDEKTGHVVEEVILYVFLGVFMIFIIDSFARASKYVR